MPPCAAYVGTRRAVASLPNPSRKGVPMFIPQRCILALSIITLALILACTSTPTPDIQATAAVTDSAGTVGPQGGVAAEVPSPTPEPTAPPADPDPGTHGYAYTNSPHFHDHPGPGSNPSANGSPDQYGDTHGDTHGYTGPDSDASALPNTNARTHGYSSAYPRPRRPGPRLLQRLAQRPSRPRRLGPRRRRSPHPRLAPNLRGIFHPLTPVSPN